MYRSILVPLDMSPFAEHALPFALALARAARASVHLVVVSTPLATASLDGAYLPPVELEEELGALYRDYLEKVKSKLGKRIDVPITGEVRFGEVATTLCDRATAGHDDLVVMATHGRGALERFLLGSVANELLHQIGVPLLLVRPGEESPDLAKEPNLKRLVVPLDGSELAERILDPAVELARLIPEIEIVLVRSMAAQAADEEDSDVADSLSYRDVERYLAGVAEKLKGRGLRARIHIVFDDDPARAILREVEGPEMTESPAEQAGLIALATHGRSGLTQLIYASVADRVVRGAHVPVLVHRAAKV